MTITPCPYCGVEVKKERLEHHKSLRCPKAPAEILAARTDSSSGRINRKDARKTPPQSRKKKANPKARMMLKLIRTMYPSMPENDAMQCAEGATKPGSNRIGVSGSEKPQELARMAVVAYARHRFTCYDSLLSQGMNRDSARDTVHSDVKELLSSWIREPKGNSHGRRR